MTGLWFEPQRCACTAARCARRVRPLRYLDLAFQVDAPALLQLGDLDRSVAEHDGLPTRRQIVEHAARKALRGARNLAFGGPDKRTLYLTAADGFFRLKMLSQGPERLGK
jgi:hypothetical protein